MFGALEKPGQKTSTHSSLAPGDQRVSVSSERRSSSEKISKFYALLRFATWSRHALPEATRRHSNGSQLRPEHNTTCFV